MTRAEPIESILVVGASLAGLRAAETLRSGGFDGRLVVVGDERGTPYDRPPLSKQVLAGEWGPERIELYPDERLAELELDLRLGCRAVSLDQRERAVGLDDGTTAAFDGLVIATGARPRALATNGLSGIHTLRSLDDCLAIRSAFEATPRRVVVVGAGFIGAEVAATARGLGLDVSMIEALAVPLEAGLGAEMGTVCADLHRHHGVDLRLGVGVEGFEGGDRVERARLADGSTIEADVVVVGIGVVPNTEWLDGSGLLLDDGVVCDETCLAAPGIVAAGDVARWPNRLFDETMRVEHWDNAVDQGNAAARRLLAGDAPGEAFTPVPWFWSDQYDRKIQLAGRPSGADEVAVVAGQVTDSRFAVAYRRGDRVTAILGFNRPRHVMKFRQLIADRASWADAMALAAEMAS